ncbi:MAG: carboxylesterase family protein [Saprospiraceae bacterium]|nr:carboxylesterase family protein [Saprospiraceae bacterium]
MLDQLQSLKWVHQNIAAFGGDPDNDHYGSVSRFVFCACAGGLSLAKGLFHKAIGHSGGILGSNRGVSLAMAEANGTKLVSQLGAGSIEDLRVMPAEELLAKAGKFNPPYSPVLDGYFLPTNIGIILCR